MIYSLSNDTWGDEEIRAAHEVIDSRFFTMGKRVSEYEREFAKKFGSKHAVMSNSGSSANLLNMAALVYSGRMHVGDEVLVTAVSWSTTYFPIVQMGLRPRLVDIELGTLNVDIAQLEAALTPRTKAVMAVNLLGNPNRFDSLLEFCERHHLILIEDNCESMGATYDGKAAGTFGVLSSFSTYYSHHLCTMEGGMSLTDDDEMYEYLLCIRSHGWTRHLPENASIHSKSDDPFYESFNFIMPGFNVRPLEIEAAIGLEQLKKLDGFVAQRRENARYFLESVAALGLITQEEVGQSSWFGFSIVLPERMDGQRDRFTSALRDSEIEVRPIVAGNFAQQKAMKFMHGSVCGPLHNADYVHRNGFFVGNHSVEMGRCIDLLCETLKSVL